MQRSQLFKLALGRKWKHARITCVVHSILSCNIILVKISTGFGNLGHIIYFDQDRDSVQWSGESFSKAISTTYECHSPSHMARCTFCIQRCCNLQCIWIDFADGVKTIVDLVNSLNICLENSASHREESRLGKHACTRSTLVIEWFSCRAARSSIPASSKRGKL